MSRENFFPSIYVKSFPGQGIMQCETHKSMEIPHFLKNFRNSTSSGVFFHELAIIEQISSFSTYVFAQSWALFVVWTCYVNGQTRGFQG